MFWMPNLALSDIGSRIAGKFEGSSMACIRHALLQKCCLSRRPSHAREPLQTVLFVERWLVIANQQVTCQGKLADTSVARSDQLLLQRYKRRQQWGTQVQKHQQGVLRPVQKEAGCNLHLW